MSTSAPPNADAATSPPQGGGAVSSLVDALNRRQQELVNQKIIEYPDQYSIEFAPEWLGNSKLRKRGDVNFSQTAMAPTTGGVPNPARTTPNPDIFSRSFDAGQSIVFVINRIMMESSYVFDQQTRIIDKNGTEFDNGTGAQNFAWYNVLCFATPTDKWDGRRRDWAYKIKYVIVPYETPVVSEYFPNGRFRGAHKNYNYWFTGQNQEVLNYEVVNNNAYFNIINTPLAGTTFRSQQNSLLTPRSAVQARSTESDQGAAERVNDIAANAADWLYNAVDYNEIRLRILGDPAWINAENFSSTADVGFGPFRSDGYINFSTGPAYFTINYNLANDLNVNTGLMNILGSAASQNTNGSTPTGPAVSFNYTAVECRSSFRQGRFEQELVGRLRLGVAGDTTRTGVNSVASATSAANSAATTSNTVSTEVRQPNVGAAYQGIQGGIADIPSTVVIGNQVLPVLVPALNPANRPLLNVSPQPYVPGVINPPVPANATPVTGAGTAPASSGSGQTMNRDP